MTRSDSAKASHGNRYDTGPTVVVTAGDQRCAWNGGVFAGDAKVVEWATSVTDLGLEVLVWNMLLKADANTPLGAFAAMASFSPGRAALEKGPQELEDFLGEFAFDGLSPRGEDD